MSLVHCGAITRTLSLPLARISPTFRVAVITGAGDRLTASHATDAANSPGFFAGHYSTLMSNRVPAVATLERIWRCRTTNPPTVARFALCDTSPHGAFFVAASTYIPALTAGPAAYVAVKYNRLVVKALFLPVFWCISSNGELDLTHF
jgi:hypothetical protein